MFLLKKYKDTKTVNPLVKTIHIVHRSLELTYCNNPLVIINSLSEEIKIKSFPPDGIPSLTELDYFFKITQGNTIIGFFRVIDLFFYGEIQLHGSYNGEKNFLIRSYFEIGRLFLKEIMNLFPLKKVSATALESNLEIRRFLEYLNFVYVGHLKDNNKYRYYRKYSNYKIISQDNNSHKRLAVVFNIYNKGEERKINFIFKKISKDNIEGKELFLTDTEKNKLRLKYDDYANLIIFRTF